MSNNSNIVGRPHKNKDIFHRFLTKRVRDRFHCLTNGGKILRNLKVESYVGRRAIMGSWISKDGKRVWGIINADSLAKVEKIRFGDRFNCLTNGGKMLRNLKVEGYTDNVIMGSWTSEDGKRVWGIINADSLAKVEKIEVRIEVGIQDIIGTERD